MAKVLDGAKGEASDLLRTCRVEESAHSGDAISWQAHEFGVFLDGRLVGCEIDAVHFVACHVAMEPLDLSAHSLKNVD